MNIVALLTGRGNNTLQDKNILPVLGKPLISYPANAAKNSLLINHFYASSDDHKILNITSSLGYKEIKRPVSLALPTSQHIDAIIHAIDYIKDNDNFTPDILVVLLANSATVKTEWIEQGITKLINDKSLSSIVPVYQDQDHHPYRAKKLDSNGNLEPFFDFTDMDISTNRQDLEPCYFLCHNFWILNVKNSIMSPSGQKPWAFLGNNIKPIMVEGCFDVHTKEDLVKTEEWVKTNIPI